MRVRVFALMHLSFSICPSTVFPPHPWGLSLQVALVTTRCPRAPLIASEIAAENPAATLQRTTETLPMRIARVHLLRPHRWELDLEQIDRLDYFPVG